MAINYLTLQDVILLNLLVTRSKNTFDALQLEEAVFCQYSPGQSTDLVGQGARFLTGLVRTSPFTVGNEATAFVGLLAFLEANGKSLRLSDAEAADWVSAVLGGGAETKGSVAERLVDSELRLEHGVPDLDEIAESVVARYPRTLSALLSRREAAT